MFRKHKITYLNPYCVQATIVALRNYMQTYTWLLFAIRMHAMSISDKSFLHLQWQTFNRNGLMSKTNFNYTKLYEVITVKERETSPALIDKMADKTCDSSSPVWNRQKPGSPHKKGSFGFTVQAAVRFFLWSSLCCIFYTGTSFATGRVISLAESSWLCRFDDKHAVRGLVVSNKIHYYHHPGIWLYLNQ